MIAIAVLVKRGDRGEAVPRGLRDAAAAAGRLGLAAFALMEVLVMVTAVRDTTAPSVEPSPGAPATVIAVAAAVPAFREVVNIACVPDVDIPRATNNEEREGW